MNNRIKYIADNVVSFVKEKKLDIKDDRVLAKVLNDFSFKNNLSQTEENDLAGLVLGLTTSEWS